MKVHSNNLICDILMYIDEHINSKISIEDLENRFFYNRYYIMKLFKSEIKLSIIEYINSLRIYNSLLQIRDTGTSLLNIAFKNGFYSIEYFSETFKKIVGVNPQIVKSYFKSKKYISASNIEKINNSFLNLYYINQIKENYLSKRKPDISPTKKLSIFK